jgi:SAM-dependent methyltransferase
LQLSQIAHVQPKIERLDDPLAFMAALAKGKSVLNVGASGGVEGYLPDNQDIGLHTRLAAAASRLVGIDIDRDSIDYAARFGVKILEANCETMDLGEKFDLIVLSDVIEHLNAPVNAVSTLAKHLAPGGKMVVTTPNGTASTVVLKGLVRKNPNVYYDHMAVYYPEHFQAIANRLGLKLTRVFFFDHMDRRNASLAWKSRIMKGLTFVLPRLAGSQMCIIENARDY